MTIDGSDRTLELGATPTLTATVTTSGNADGTIVWTSSNTDVATISPLGAVTSLSTGNTNITATSITDPTKSDAITLTVVDSAGGTEWTRQFGSFEDEEAYGVATDASGNVYVTGRTYGDLDGNSGGDDAFIRSHDSSGDHRWTAQFGTGLSDVAYGIATDGNGNVYVSGSTGGALDGAFAGGRDAFVRSYDSDGTLRWTRQFGASLGNVSLAIATDANGNVYAAGYTMSALEGVHAGENDAFIRSYDATGALRWTAQFGTSTGDMALGVATDAIGNVYATGYTFGTFEGATSSGGFDAYVRSYDGEGGHRWTRQFGTVSIEMAQAVATDETGNVYVVGHTNGALEGASLGGYDAFTRKHGP